MGVHELALQRLILWVHVPGVYNGTNACQDSRALHAEAKAHVNPGGVLVRMERKKKNCCVFLYYVLANSQSFHYYREQGLATHRSLTGNTHLNPVKATQKCGVPTKSKSRSSHFESDLVITHSCAAKSSPPIANYASHGCISSFSHSRE